MNRDSKQPSFKTLGSKLKSLREQVFESLADVSGALEIDISKLAKIEQGNLLPSEEILLMLMAHFAVKDDEASRIWEMAGYNESKLPLNSSSGEELPELKPQLIIIPQDNRIVYSDQVHVMVNNYGVVMNFMQNSGNGKHPLAVSKIGMSREHAQSVLKVLQQTLEQSKTTRPQHENK